MFKNLRRAYRKRFPSKEEKIIKELREALILIHDNPYNRNLIVSTSQDILFKTKKYEGEK